MLIFADSSLSHSQFCCDLFLLESVFIDELSCYKCPKSRDDRLRSDFAGNYQKLTATGKDEQSI